MSSFFVTATPGADLDPICSDMAFTRYSKITTIRKMPISIVQARVDSEAIWGAAEDPLTGVTVVLAGRVAFDRSEWSKADTLPYLGGAASKLILHRWLCGPSSGIEDYCNGSFCILIWDPRATQLHVITDRMGIHPVFMFDGAPLTIGDHPDVLAKALHLNGRDEQIDYATLAEFISTDVCIHPRTYYKKIKSLDPASHYLFRISSSGEWSQAKTVYWTPDLASTKPPLNDADALEALVESFKRSIRKRSDPFLGKTGVFLSGGADSRLMVFGAADRGSVEAMTFYDEPNPELDIAQKLARIAGVPHHAFQRSPDYYGEQVEDVVRISGGMGSIIDAHYYGFLKRVHDLRMDTLLTGCYADYMFKGVSFNRHAKSIFGRWLPIYDISDFDYVWYQPELQMAGKWQRLVRERNEEYFPAALRGDYRNNILRIEDLRLRPLSREADHSGRMIMLRTMPWDPPMGDTDVLGVYERLKPEQKINGILFGRAVSRITGSPANRLFNNNYGAPVHAGKYQRIAYYLLRIARQKAALAKARIKTGQKISQAAIGSWPEWTPYISSSASIRRLWSEPSARETEFFEDLLGANPWSTPIDQWATHNSLAFMRLVTCRTWLKQQRLF